MTVEWVVYACPTCGIQHDQGDTCWGTLRKGHDGTTVERVELRADELDRLRDENEELREKINELTEELNELSEQL